MKFSSFAVTQEVFDFEIEDAVCQLKALNADQYATVEMYLMGNAESILNQNQKFSFVNKNVLGWSGVKNEDDTELKYSEESRLLLLDARMDQFLNLLILECYRKRRATIDKIEDDKKEAGK